MYFTLFTSYTALVAVPVMDATISWPVHVAPISLKRNMIPCIPAQPIDKHARCRQCNAIVQLHAILS